MNFLKSLPVIAAFTAVSMSGVSAQSAVKAEQGRNCHSMEVLKANMAENPEVKANMDAVEAHTQKVLAMKGKPTTGGGDGGTGGGTPSGVITIPVYVHVIYNTAQENISDAQIQSQIDVLNEDYRAMNSDKSKTPAEFSGLVSDIEIQFTLAGVTRKYSTKTSWGTRDAMKKSKNGGVDPIDPARNLNMWVCNIGGGILGYAQFPGGSSATDGVVASPQYFGSSKKGNGFYLDAPYDLGRTMTHEVGHWLNLRHIWGDGGCGATDYVADTPDSDGPNYGCPSYPSVACGTNDMTMNYMDYTDDPCMYMFSNGQKERMRALFASGGARAAMAGNVANLDGSNSEASVKAGKDFSVNVYPNPADDEAFISINTAGKDVTLKVVDIQGKVVESKSFSGAEGNVEHSLNVSGLKAGIYFVNVIGEGTKETKKLVVK
jgi:hypothetical protein